ncbi:hypothetical protein PC116_g5685 [Phytophthora cactorum]|nr:hypothetical protein PC116_g5685 [Phytophthora cactorum]
MCPNRPTVQFKLDVVDQSKQRADDGARYSNRRHHV